MFALIIAAVALGGAVAFIVLSERSGEAPSDAQSPSLHARLASVSRWLEPVLALGAAAATAGYLFNEFRNRTMVTVDVLARGMAVAALIAVLIAWMRARRRRAAPRGPVCARQTGLASVVILAIVAVAAAHQPEVPCDIARPQSEPRIDDRVLSDEPSAPVVHSAAPGVIRRGKEQPPAPLPDRQPRSSGERGVGDLVVSGCIAERGN